MVSRPIISPPSVVIGLKMSLAPSLLGVNAFNFYIFRVAGRKYHQVPNGFPRTTVVVGNRKDIGDIAGRIGLYSYF